MRPSMIPLAVALVAATVGARAQQAKPPVRPVEPSASISLTVRGAEATPYLTVKTTSAELRGLLRDMAKKAGVTLFLSPSVSGTFTGTFETIEVDAAIATVASASGCKLMRIALPANAPPITADAAAKVYEAMDALPQAAVAWDAQTQKSLVAKDGATPAASGAQMVYYVQGKLSPDQERAGVEKRTTDRMMQASTPAAITNSTVQAFLKMPIQDRVQAMRDMQRQMMQGLSPQERRQVFGGGGNRGRRGG